MLQLLEATCFFSGHYCSNVLSNAVEKKITMWGQLLRTPPFFVNSIHIILLSNQFQLPDYFVDNVEKYTRLSHLLGVFIFVAALVSCSDQSRLASCSIRMCWINMSNQLMVSIGFLGVALCIIDSDSKIFREINHRAIGVAPFLGNLQMVSMKIADGKP